MAAAAAPPQQPHRPGFRLPCKDRSLHRDKQAQLLPCHACSRCASVRIETGRTLATPVAQCAGRAGCLLEGGARAGPNLTCTLVGLSAMFIRVAFTIWLLTVYWVDSPMRPAPASRSLMKSEHILPFLMMSDACSTAQGDSDVLCQEEAGGRPGARGRCCCCASEAPLQAPRRRRGQAGPPPCTARGGCNTTAASPVRIRRMPIA